jgi:hypothetical protein
VKAEAKKRLLSLARIEAAFSPRKIEVNTSNALCPFSLE